MATHSSILAREIPLTEEPGRLESIGPKELDTTELSMHTYHTIYTFKVYNSMIVSKFTGTCNHQPVNFGTFLKSPKDTSYPRGTVPSTSTPASPWQPLAYFLPLLVSTRLLVHFHMNLLCEL